MIQDDRIELNKRFIRVFEALESKGEIIKNDRNGKGVGDFAERILGKKGYGHIIQAFLNNDSKRVISYSQCRQLCREFGISEDYMLHGLGDMFVSAKSNKSMLRPVTNTGVFPGLQGNIQYTSFRAFAGDAIPGGSGDAEGDYDDDKFTIPGVSGHGLVAFPISGNSMEPIISDGDIVVCRPIENIKDVKENEIYAVRSNGSVWVKHVQTVHEKGSGRLMGLKLISANHLEYDPFIEDLNDNMRLYKVVRRICEIK